MTFKVKSKKLFIYYFIFSLISTSIIFPIPSLTQSTNVDITIDEYDGFWQIDDFTDIDQSTKWKIENCTITEDGKIMLEDSGTDNPHQNYNFSTEDIDNAMHGSTFFSHIFPPIIYDLASLPIYFKGNIDKDDEKFFSQEETPIKQYHYFKFKIDQNRDEISHIIIQWIGKALNPEKVSLYYWEPISDIQRSYIGLWQEAQRTNNSDEITFNYALANDIPLDEKNYLYLCIVVVPDLGKKCRLYTDFINVRVYSQNIETYKTKGVVISEPISVKDIAYWEYFTYDQQEEKDSSITYKLLYQNSTGTYALPSKYRKTISGIPAIFLTQTPTNYTLKIQATLTPSSNGKHSPIIDMWGITWQTTNGTWNDYFNSSASLRIDRESMDKTIQNIAHKKIDFRPSIDLWQMFGQNPENTRSSSLKGPDATDMNNLQWGYYSTKVGSSYSNPIFYDNIIYIPTTDGKSIYGFDISEIDSGTQVTEPDFSIDLPDTNLIVDNTPAIAYDVNDQEALVIVSTDSTTNMDNKIYAFDAELNEKKWEYDFDKGDIRYASSPTVADDTIFVTSVHETLIGKENNKIIALDFDGKELWDEDLPAPSYASPAVSGSYVYVGCSISDGSSLIAFNKNTGKMLWNASIGKINRASPVIADDLVICTTVNSGIISVVAVNKYSGKTQWTYEIGTKTYYTNLNEIGCSSPAVANSIIYIATPEHKLYAISLKEGNLTTLWEENPVSIPHKINMPDRLISSPVYADGKIYIGTQKGLYAFKESTGDKVWDTTKFIDHEIKNSPIICDGYAYYCTEDNTYNGLWSIGASKYAGEVHGEFSSMPIHLPNPSIYTWKSVSITPEFSQQPESNEAWIEFSVYDDNNKKVLTFNTKDHPNEMSLTTLNKASGTTEYITLNAHFITTTNDIEMAISDWNVEFLKEGTSEPVFSDFTIVSEIPLVCNIDVQDTSGLLNTSAQYRLFYDNTTTENLQYPENGWDSIPVDFTNQSTDVETLEVNISSIDALKDSSSTMEISKNISDLWIEFRISNINGTLGTSEPYLLLSPNDREKPVFFVDEFTPNTLYISTPTPLCTITAQDKGTEGNITGLNISSATFDIQYENQQSNIKTETFNASCTGTEGTKTKVKLTADIASLDISDNISELIKIRFSISDMARNKNTTSWFELSFDEQPPTSYITNSDAIGSKVNTSPVTIRVNATDAESGIQEVGLYYKRSDNTDWTLFGSRKSVEPYTWDFSLKSNETGGEYIFSSIAKDNAGNEENYPSTPDATFIFDPKKPLKPSFDSLYEFTKENANEDEIPIFSDVTFTDDYQLDLIWYRLNFEGTNEWTPLIAESIKQDSLSPVWSLTQNQWDRMLEDITYSIYFKVSDTLGNIYETPSSSEAMKIKKNFKDDTETIKPDFSDFDNWKWNNEYEIIVDINETEYQSAILYYSYNTSNTTNHSWKPYGEEINNGSISWKFSAPDGDGYYSFYVEIIDSQGSMYSSNITTKYISYFPLIELGLISGLAVALIVVTIILYKKRKKTGKQS